MEGIKVPVSGKGKSCRRTGTPQENRVWCKMVPMYQNNIFMQHYCCLCLFSVSHFQIEVDTTALQAASRCSWEC